MEIYLDNSATTKVRKEVLEEIIEIHEKYYGNPSSLHRMGLQIEKKIDNTRETIAKFINSMPEEIIFTSGGTESNNLAILGHLKKINNNTNIITTKIEHPSVYNIFKHFEKNYIKVHYLDVDEHGFINIEQLDNLLNINTKLVSIMMVNNEIGTIQDIKTIASIIKSKNKNTKIHVDGIQAFGKVAIDVEELNIDSLSFSSHKIHGPKGVGGLFVKSNKKINPIVYGGNQEKGLRAGTENTTGIIGFGKAVELLSGNLENEIERINEIKLLFAQKITNSIDGIKINSILNQNGAPHILSVSFKNIKGEVLLHYLENYGIYVSTKSACSSRNNKASRTLNSIGLDSNYIDGTIRFSFGHFNSKEEIDFVIQKIKESVDDIRKIIK